MEPGLAGPTWPCGGRAVLSPTQLQQGNLGESQLQLGFSDRPHPGLEMEALLSDELSRPRGGPAVACSWLPLSSPCSGPV